MALLIECPNCKNRNSLKNLICKCGKKIRKGSNKCYWIEYYIDGQRKRERIGHSKLAAENRLEEAYEVSQSTNNFPEICGSICPQDRLCEGNCVIEKGFE